MDDWHQAIFEFWNANCGEPWLKVALTGNCSFKAVVEFCSDRRSTSVRTTAKITRNGVEDGTISLNQVKGFSVNDYHTLFRPISPGRCSYVSSENALVIRGESPKKMGSYVVTIRPAA